MKVELHYGSDFISLDIPDKNIGSLIRPHLRNATVDNRTLIQQALAQQQFNSFQRGISDKHLCVLLPDGTRDIPLDDILAELLSLLQKARSIEFLICTGTHNAGTVENDRLKQQIVKTAAQAGLGNWQLHIHDYRCDSFASAGQTSYGTEVMFNTVCDDVDTFLVLSDVKCHYFAGYSNPVKNFVPGICDFETARQNHRLTLNDKSTFGTHPWHRDPARRDNPLACDQLDGMKLIVRERSVYALTTVSTSGRIQWAQFGPADEVSTNAFDATDSMNTHFARPTEYLIVSPGGLPNDVDLYIAQRALELTGRAVKDDGEILFICQCPKGVGEEQTMENFYNRLAEPIDKILESIQAEYKLFSHKPYKFALMLSRLRRIWLYSEIPDELITAAHMHPTHQPQIVINDWLKERPDAKINIVDGANKIALYAEK